MQSIDNNTAILPKNNSTVAPALSLTPDDVSKLLSVENATQARFDVAQKMATHYETSHFAKDEALIAEQIFRLLVRDAETDIRRMLAETLKSSASIPKDIVLTMAQDIDEVALPVLKHNEVLSDIDLIDIVRSSASAGKQKAIASRETLSENVSSALVATDNKEVLSTLLDNPGASISDYAMEEVITRHRQTPEVMERMALREALPPAIVEKIVHAVSETLAGELRKRYSLSQTSLQEEEEKTRESATLILIRRAKADEAEMDRLIQQLITFRRLSPTLLLAALSHGEVSFFERSMAALADVPPANARKLLQDPGALGFRAVFNRSCLQEEWFSPFRIIYMYAAELKGNGEKSLPGEAFKQALEAKLAASKETDENIANACKFVEQCVV